MNGYLVSLAMRARGEQATLVPVDTPIFTVPPSADTGQDSERVARPPGRGRPAVADRTDAALSGNGADARGARDGIAAARAVRVAPRRPAVSVVDVEAFADPEPRAHGAERRDETIVAAEELSIPRTDADPQDLKGTSDSPEREPSSVLEKPPVPTPNEPARVEATVAATPRDGATSAPLTSAVAMAGSFAVAASAGPARQIRPGVTRRDAASEPDATSDESVRITIGRIEVHAGGSAAAPPVPVVTPAAIPRLSLAEYLRRRRKSQP